MNSDDEGPWQEANAHLTRANSIYITMHNISASYAQLAVRSAILLNGGALFAMPAFFAAIMGKEVAEAIVVSAMVKAGALFIAGIVAAAVCCLIAYIDYQLNAESERGEAHLETQNLFEKYDADTFHRMKKDREEYRTEMKTFLQRISKWNSRTSQLGLLSGILSYVFFCWASYIAGMAIIQN